MEDPRCQSCGSTDVDIDVRGAAKPLTGQVAVESSRYACNDCLHEAESPRHFTVWLLAQEGLMPAAESQMVH